MAKGLSILEKSSQRLRQSGSIGRGDLVIADFQPIADGSKQGTLLISYDRNVGSPTGRQIEECLINKFGNQVQANLNSMKIHEDECAVSVLANTLVFTRPITDANDQNKFAMISPLSYLDLASKSIWNIVSDDAGQKHMVRYSEENLSDIVANRKQSSRIGPKLASLKTSAVAVCEGDSVQFYDSGIVAYGEVTKVSGNKITIKAKTGDVTVDVQAVFKVTKKAPTAISDEKNLLKDYFAKAFGNEDYASELTRTTSAEEGGGRTGR